MVGLYLMLVILLLCGHMQNGEERDFISVISDFVLQQKQKKVIEQKMF